MKISKLKTLDTWSDTCGGQIRKYTLTSLFLRLIHGYPSIHWVPISGHYLSNDRDLMHIQKTKKKKDATYTVAQYQKLKESSTKKNPSVH